MKTKPVLTHDEVTAMLQAAQAEAERQGWRVSIAVVDDGGHLLGLRRLDGAPPISAAMSAEKAKSAALGRRPSKGYEDMINGGRTAFLSAPLAGMLEGALPLVAGGEVAGAVGVSGVRPEQDALVAAAALAAVAAA